MAQAKSLKVSVQTGNVRQGVDGVWHMACQLNLKGLHYYGGINKSCLRQLHCRARSSELDAHELYLVVPCPVHQVFHHQPLKHAMLTRSVCSSAAAAAATAAAAALVLAKHICVKGTWQQLWSALQGDASCQLHQTCCTQQMVNCNPLEHRC
jgi:hypothetical protein